MADIRKKLEEHEKRISILEDLNRSEPEAVRKELSVKEFLLEKRPKDDIQKTLGIGYYLEKYRKTRPFNVKDLTDGFQAAKEKIPGNMSDKVAKNIQKGYMMPMKEKKDKLFAYQLTNSGEKYVESGFKGE